MRPPSLKRAQRATFAWFNYVSVLFFGLKPHQLSAAPVFFIHVLRRIIFVLVAMYFFDHPWLQVFLYMLQSLGMAWYLLTNRPFLLPIRNTVEIFNELAVLAAAYHMTVIMSEHHVTRGARELVGQSLVAVVATMILVNALVWAYALIV